MSNFLSNRSALAPVAVVLMLCGFAPAQTRVVILSLDGLRPDAITAEHAPNLENLRDSGVSATEALNDLPSATMPNHATMLTGVTSKRHGVVINFDTPTRIGVPTIFDYAHNAGKRCAFFASKEKLDFLANPDSCEVIDLDGDLGALVDRFRALLAPGGPDLLFLHLRDPDSTGHQEGWMSPAYLEAVRQSDERVGRVIAAVAAEPERPTYLLVTADHGGDGKNHFLNIPANRRIPWIVSGPDTIAGSTIDGIVSIADTTSTALWLLGIDLPANLDGVVQSRVRGGGDSAGDWNSDSGSAPPITIPCAILPLFGLAFWMRVRKSRRLSRVP